MSSDPERQQRTPLCDDPVDVGVYSLTRGRRTANVTRTISEVCHAPETIGMYGLFDGHGGATAPDMYARNFVPTIMGDSSLQKDPERAIRRTCQAVGAFVTAKSNLDKLYYGSNLLFAMIKDDRLIVANVGNSRAVLCSEDGVEAITRQHRGSNADLARTRKVNDIFRVPRCIRDAESEERKAATLPSLKMTRNNATVTPDIYRRHLSQGEKFLVLATAEVWEHLPDKHAVQLVQEVLKRQESPQVAAERVALSMMRPGTNGPLSVMILVFPSARVYYDKVPSLSRHRAIRYVRRPNSNRRRHSSNTEQELSSSKARKAASSRPTSARVADPRPEQKRERPQSAVTLSTITSPSWTTVVPGDDEAGCSSAQIVKGLSTTTQLSNREDPSSHTLRTYNDWKDVSGRRRRVLPNGERPNFRSDSALGTEEVSCCPDDEVEILYSRKQIDMQRKVPIERRCQDRKNKSSARAKSAVASSSSEITGSGFTGDETSTAGSLVPGFGDFFNTGTSGPSKVRYRGDGSIQSGRFGFLKDLGRTFVRKR